MENEKTSLVIKYFFDHFPIDLLIDKSKPKDEKEEKALFYFNGIMEIFMVFDRLIKYDIYFKSFYPKDEVLISNGRYPKHCTLFRKELSVLI